jgi:hypothetical protein
MWLTFPRVCMQVLTRLCITEQTSQKHIQWQSIFSRCFLIGKMPSSRSLKSRLQQTRGLEGRCKSEVYVRETLKGSACKVWSGNTFGPVFVFLLSSQPLLKWDPSIGEGESGKWWPIPFNGMSQLARVGSYCDGGY